MTLKGAIFDLDGTLLDSMFIWETIGEDYLRSLGIEPHEKLNEKFKDMSLYQAACHYKSEYGVAGTPEEIMLDVNKQIEDLYIHKVLPKQGVPEHLEALRTAGVTMCIATATDEYLVHAALKRNALLPYFSKIFTCTSVGHGKDKPDIFNAALRHLGTDKRETLVFEDALYAIQTAKQAGFTVCAVHDRLATESDEIRRLADYYLSDFTKAKEVIR